jgi:hypothetical protein
MFSACRALAFAFPDGVDETTQSLLAHSIREHAALGAIERGLQICVLIRDVTFDHVPAPRLHLPSEPCPGRPAATRGSDNNTVGRSLPSDSNPVI